jgi:hypothetical protein
LPNNPPNRGRGAEGLTSSGFSVFSYFFLKILVVTIVVLSGALAGLRFSEFVFVLSKMDVIPTSLLEANVSQG